MNDIDFIKKCCVYADGFSIGRDGFVYYCCKRWPLEYTDFDTIVYPLLLQRAIEGINEKGDEFFVNQNHCGIVIQDLFEYEIQFKALELDIDKAKRSALEYVFSEADK